MPKRNIESDAILISELIRATDTDDRGLLFKLIAEDLKKYAQGATGSMIEAVATHYGYPEDMVPSYERKKRKRG